MSTIRKFLVAASAALAVAVTATLDDVVTTSEWLAMLVAGLGAVGVYVVPNKATPEPEIGDE
jgi:hypothetical protein